MTDHKRRVYAEMQGKVIKALDFVWLQAVSRTNWRDHLLRHLSGITYKHCKSSAGEVEGDEHCAACNTPSLKRRKGVFRGAMNEA